MRIDAYPGPPGSGPPIAWTVTKGGTTEGPHNGRFDCFSKSGGKCETDITQISGLHKPGDHATFQGTLEFSHYVNNNPGQGEDARTATKPGKFTPESKSDMGTIKILWRRP